MAMWFRNEHIHKRHLPPKSVNTVNCPIFLYYTSKNKYAKMIKRNCSLCVRRVCVCFFYFPFMDYFLPVVFFHAPYVTLFMRAFFAPSLVRCLPFIDRKNRIAVIDMKQCVDVCFLFHSRLVRFVFAVQLSRDAQSPNPYNPNAYFIYQSGIHPFQFDALSHSLIFIHSLFLSLFNGNGMTRPLNNPVYSSIAQKCQFHTESERKKARAHSQHKSTENGKNAPVGPKWSILGH